MLQSHWIEIDDARWHVISGGEGRTLLFLHGFPEFWFAWRPQLAHFARSHRVIAVDLPGFNRSAPLPTDADYALPAVADRLAALIRRLSPNAPVVLVGHDLGGVLAWELAARHPQRVDRLVAINAPPAALLAREAERCPRQRAASAYRHALAAPGAEHRLAADGHAALHASFAAIPAPHRYTLLDRQAHDAAWSRPGVLDAMLGYYRAWPASIAPVDPIQMPALVLWGDEDPYLLPGCLDGIGHCAREVEVVRVPGGSHWLNREQPERVNDQIRRFLDRPRTLVDFSRLAPGTEAMRLSYDAGEHGSLLGRGAWPLPQLSAGRTAFTLRIDRAHAGIGDIAHGGLLYAALDELMGWLVAAHTGQRAVTASASIQYLASLRVGAEYVFEARPEPDALASPERIPLRAQIHPLGEPGRPIVRMQAIFSVAAPEASATPAERPTGTIHPMPTRPHAGSAPLADERVEVPAERVA